MLHIGVTILRNPNPGTQKPVEVWLHLPDNDLPPEQSSEAFMAGSFDTMEEALRLLRNPGPFTYSIHIDAKV